MPFIQLEGDVLEQISQFTVIAILLFTFRYRVWPELYSVGFIEETMDNETLLKDYKVVPEL